MATTPRIVIEVDQLHSDPRRYRINIAALDAAGAGTGHRLYGPKYSFESGDTVAECTLDSYDAAAIRRYLDRGFPPAASGELPTAQEPRHPDELVSIRDELDSIELDIERVMNSRPEFVEVGQRLLDRLGGLRVSIEVSPAYKTALSRGQSGTTP